MAGEVDNTLTEPAADHHVPQGTDEELTEILRKINENLEEIKTLLHEQRPRPRRNDLNIR